MPKTPRERFEEIFSYIEDDKCIMSKGDHGDGHACEEEGVYGMTSAYYLPDVWRFVETLLEEARQEGYKAGAMFGYSEGIETCIVSLQGAKESFNKKSL